MNLRLLCRSLELPGRLTAEDLYQEAMVFLQGVTGSNKQSVRNHLIDVRRYELAAKRGYKITVSGHDIDTDGDSVFDHVGSESANPLLLAIQHETIKVIADKLNEEESRVFQALLDPDEELREMSCKVNSKSSLIPREVISRYLGVPVSRVIKATAKIRELAIQAVAS